MKALITTALVFGLAAASASATGVDYRQVFKTSGCTQERAQRGCDIHKTTEWNLKNGFIPAYNGKPLADELTFDQVELKETNAFVTDFVLGEPAATAKNALIEKGFKRIAPGVFQKGERKVILEIQKGRAAVTTVR